MGAEEAQDVADSKLRVELMRAAIDEGNFTEARGYAIRQQERDEIERTAHADDTWQSLCTAPTRYQAELCMLIADASIFSQENHIRCKHELKTTCQREPLNGGNDRQVRRFQSLQQTMATQRAFTRLIAITSKAVNLVEIITRAEVSSLCPDQDGSDILIGFKFPKRLTDDLDRTLGHGVEFFRTRQLKNANPSFNGNKNGLGF